MLAQNTFNQQTPFAAFRRSGTRTLSCLPVPPLIVAAYAEMHPPRAHGGAFYGRDWGGHDAALRCDEHVGPRRPQPLFLGGLEGARDPGPVFRVVQDLLGQFGGEELQQV